MTFDGNRCMKYSPFPPLSIDIGIGIYMRASITVSICNCTCRITIKITVTTSNGIKLESPPQNHIHLVPISLQLPLETIPQFHRIFTNSIPSYLLLLLIKCTTITITACLQIQTLPLFHNLDIIPHIPLPLKTHNPSIPDQPQYTHPIPITIQNILTIHIRQKQFHHPLRRIISNRIIKRCPPPLLIPHSGGIPPIFRHTIQQKRDTILVAFETTCVMEWGPSFRKIFFNQSFWVCLDEG
mmetsp:Transcript_16163/g.24162  ORF Transcript_16163/g.24162 Transcript_16163/m.24162 type:complete len:240 (+) Transcript_16163:1696-2415(+)